MLRIVPAGIRRPRYLRPEDESERFDPRRMVYLALRLSQLHALLLPLGSAPMLYASVGSVASGRRVRWKGRAYTAG